MSDLPAAPASLSARPARPPRRGPTGKKLWLYRLALLLILLPLLELISWVGLCVADPQVSFAGLHDDQEQLCASACADRPEVVHPYVGWVLNPQTHRQAEVG